MKFDYDKARKFVSLLAAKVEREELKGDDYWEEDSGEEKDQNVEDAAIIKEAVEIGGNLIVDIAESLNRIAQGDKFSSGRRM
jgi:hypothetical protein